MPFIVIGSYNQIQPLSYKAECWIYKSLIKEIHHQSIHFYKRPGSKLKMELGHQASTLFKADEGEWASNLDYSCHLHLEPAGSRRAGKLPALRLERCAGQMDRDSKRMMEKAGILKKNTAHHEILTLTLPACIICTSSATLLPMFKCHFHPHHLPILNFKGPQYEIFSNFLLIQVYFPITLSILIKKM